MITKETYDKLYSLATEQRFTNERSLELQTAIQTYINTTYSVCLRCVQQLKHGQKIILNYLSNVVVSDGVKPDLDIKVDEVKEPCAKCKRSKTNKG